MSGKTKIGRNEPCPCGSGQKYKYCCIGKTPRERHLPIWEDSTTGEKLSLNMTDDILNWAAQAELPLKNFCKDNDFYFFGLAITVGQCQKLDEKLKEGTLTKQMFLDTYKENCKQEPIMGLLEVSCQEFEIFNKRKQILVDAFEAHYAGKYTLSIPTLFTQLEGLLRDVVSLQNKDSIKPTIQKNIWENKLLFSVKDDSENYNGFIHKLFEGNGNPDKFNRNPVLHGFKIDYYSEEHSLILLLAILEIRLFKWWDNKTEDYTKRFKVTKKENGKDITTDTK